MADGSAVEPQENANRIGRQLPDYTQRPEQIQQTAIAILLAPIPNISHNMQMRRTHIAIHGGA